MTTELTIRRPDDWHLHLRDGDMMRAVLPATAELFGRAIIMPNLVPPVCTARDAIAYRERIMACLPPGHAFEPLMTVYLTDATDPKDLVVGYADGAFVAAKLYPAGATTNSASGVTAIEGIGDVLETMARIGMPLLVHGEVTDPEIDIFDREAVFIDRVLEPARRRIPELRVVVEHATTAVAVDYVRSAEAGLAATITPHHLLINRNAIFAGGINPHMYCLPVAKRERHRLALRAAATSGDARFFLGTDSAPHPRRDKETSCGCAGIFNAPTALACVAQAFEDDGALDRLEGFVSSNGPKFYRMAENSDHITLRKIIPSGNAYAPVVVGDDQVEVFVSREPPSWEVAPESRRSTSATRATTG